VVLTIGLRPRLADRPVRSFRVVTTAFDQDANFKARGSSSQMLDVSASAASSTAPEYQLVSHLMLPRGHYQIRVATEGGGQSGSVFADVDVPDFAKSPVSLSGLILTHARSSALAGMDLVANLIPVVPTVDREFRPGRAASAFLRVYQGGSKPPIGIRVTSTIVDDRNRTVLDKTTFLEGSRFTSNRGADFTIELPLASLEVGEYLLTIEATLGKTVVTRDARFVVR